MYNKKLQAARAAASAIQRMAHSNFAQIHAHLHQSIEGENDEAMAALRLLQNDIWAVCAPGDAKSSNHGITLALQRKASRCAAKALGARGTYDHPAWRNLVEEIYALLHHRSQYGGAGDDAARARLLGFVHENADALRLLGGPVAS